MSRYIVVILVSLALTWGDMSADVTPAASGEVAYDVEELVTGLGIPWGMTFVGPTGLLVTEKEGAVKLIDLAGKTPKVTAVTGPPAVRNRGQGGLLDVAVPGDYTAGDWIYFTYSKKSGQGAATTLARARLEKNSLVDWQELLETRSVTGTNKHFGSRITFDGKGHLFFSVGDRGVRPNSQDRSTHAGSILRLNLDGSVPEDNPFTDGSALPEIWSYGHRNPQGLFWDSATGRLWANEHGPRGGDEINLIEAGGNYGWPLVSHGREYASLRSVGEATSKPGMVDPVKIYIPSIAPGSLIVYSGTAFPEWRGNLFSGALALQHLNRVELDTKGRPKGEERLLADMDERIRALAESPEGWIYFSTDSGRILRIKPSVP